MILYFINNQNTLIAFVKVSLYHYKHIIYIYSCYCCGTYTVDHTPTDAGGACKTFSQRTRARATRGYCTEKKYREIVPPYALVWVSLRLAPMIGTYVESLIN